MKNMKNTEKLMDRLNVTGVTLQELADIVGTNRMALYRWDNGGNVSPIITSFIKGLDYTGVAQKQGKTYSVGQMQALANEIKRLKSSRPDSNLVELWEAWKAKQDIKGTFVAVNDIRRFLEHITGS